MHALDPRLGLSAVLSVLTLLALGCAPPAGDAPAEPAPPGEPASPADPETPPAQPPLGLGAGPYAYYTRIDSGAAWERHAFVGPYADIVVRLPDSEVRFWRGSSYRPGWTTPGASPDSAVYAPQHFATAGDGDGLRFDRINRHAYARIIRQSDGEAVVHWRYAPVFDTGVDPLHPGWTGWVDEYYTFAADGRTSRRILAHDDGVEITTALTLGADGALVETELERRPLTYAPPAADPDDRLPRGPDRDFGARYTRLGYAGPWDRGPADDYAPPTADWSANWQVGEHPDVVVDFDGDGTQWVFWRGLGFVPSMVSPTGAWFSNEFNESWGWPEMCEEGGAEPMNDKQARYSHVRIIESTPARAVVQWRYHPTGICYNLIDTADSPDGWGATAEFVFYIYPDGSALSQNTLRSRQVNTWGGGPNGFEYHEAMIMHGPGAMPSDNIEIHDTVTVMDLDDGLWVFDGADGGINADEQAPFVDGAVNIARVNLRGAYDTFTIMPEGEDNIIAPYWDDDFENSSPDGHFVSWDHWPVNNIRAFGRGSRENRYPSHTSLFHMYDGPPSAMGEAMQQRLLLTGLTDRDDAFVRRLARSWLRPPAIEPGDGVDEARHDATERAYRLRASAPRLDFTLAGSTDGPIINPAFVIDGWPEGATADVFIDGAPADGLRQGIVRNTDGTPTLLLFAPLEREATLRVEVRARE